MKTQIEWMSLKKKKPPEGIDILICDDSGYISLEDTEGVNNNYRGKMTWWASWKYGNGTKILYWAYLPKVPVEIDEDSHPATQKRR